MYLLAVNLAIYSIEGVRSTRVIQLLLPISGLYPRRVLVQAQVHPVQHHNRNRIGPRPPPGQ